MNLYIVGSLANPRIPEVARVLRTKGFDVFDHWFCAGPEADKCWQAKMQGDGASYREALQSAAAQNVFNFDLTHLEEADVVVLIAPAGKSAHLELGYAAGQGKPTFMLMEEEPVKWDVMALFAQGIAYTVDELEHMILAAFVLDDTAAGRVVG